MLDVEPDVLVVGESLVDIVRRADGSLEEFPGGSAANVAVALARLGRPVRFVTSFADDEHGRLVAGHLDRAGVSLAAEPGAVARTSTAMATLQPDGSARYDFDLDWRINAVADGAPPLVVHTCSLGAVLAPGAADVLALVRGLRAHATVTYDVNARPAITGTGPDVVEAVERVVAVADLVKASDEDLDALYPGTDHAGAATALLARGPIAVVVTRGGAGATWYSRSGVVEVAARPVEVADTIGAGDTFGAALVDALWSRGLLGAGSRAALAALDAPGVTAVLAYAARAAAVTVSRPGADPPYRSELGEHHT
jgi:fructokinase